LVAVVVEVTLLQYALVIVVTIQEAGVPPQPMVDLAETQSPFASVIAGTIQAEVEVAAAHLPAQTYRYLIREKQLKSAL
jgi:hypothetical protein